MSKFIVDPEVQNVWKKLTTDGSPISWFTCGYPEGNNNSLVVTGEGNGGMPEFISKLPPDDVVWGVFKVVGCDDRGNLVSRRSKWIFVKYLPQSAPTMRKARAGGHKGAIKQVIDAHIDIEIENPADLTEESIIQKLRAAGGAHAPNSYEFSNYSGGSSA